MDMKKPVAVMALGCMVAAGAISLDMPVGEREIDGLVEPREVVHALDLLALRPPALQADGADAQARQVVLVGREAREVAVEDLAADHPLVVVRIGLGTRHERPSAFEFRVAVARHHARQQRLDNPHG